MFDSFYEDSELNFVYYLSYAESFLVPMANLMLDYMQKPI